MINNHFLTICVRPSSPVIIPKIMILWYLVKNIIFEKEAGLQWMSRSVMQELHYEEEVRRGKGAWKEIKQYLRREAEDRRKEMKVCLNWCSQMQMEAFMPITMICFFMPVCTSPVRASGQPSACSALITVSRSFIWRTFIYSFNFLSFMCSAFTPHRCYMGARSLECTTHFWKGNVLWGFITFHVSIAYCIFKEFCCHTPQDRDQEERFLNLGFTNNLSDAFSTSSWHIWCCPGHVVSQSEAGSHGCFDRTCKSIPFTGKQRLIPQWPDRLLLVGFRPHIWVGWYQADSVHLSPLV